MLSKAFPLNSVAHGFSGERECPIDAVFVNLKDGFSVDEVVAMFDGLTHEQVNAVLEFAGGI